MNTKTALQGTVTATGPLVLAAGTAMLTVALANSALGGPQGQAALPRQTVTVTPAPSAGASSAAGGSRSSPSPDPSGRQVLAVESTPAERTGGASRGGRSAEAPGRGEQDPPSSPPSPPPAEERCPDGQLVTVTLPLGVLPCDAVQIGGTR